MEKKINWSMIASVLFGFVLSLLGWIVQIQERRLSALESWRQEQDVMVSTRLAQIETKINQLLMERK